MGADCRLFRRNDCAGVFLRKREKTKEEFLVANRSMPWLLTAFSMAATWVWAPSMFVASEKAYTQGIAGVFGLSCQMC